MHKAHINCDFGRVSLFVNVRTPAAVINEATTVSPVIPAGMRVDNCQLVAVTANCLIDEIIEIGIEFKPAPRWSLSHATGEWLEAYELENPDGACGSFGLRDPDWFEEFRGLKFLDIHQASDGNLKVTFQSLQETEIRFELASAVTYNATTEQLAVSPWFAVDMALSS